jgi:hypothetical protein
MAIHATGATFIASKLHIMRLRLERRILSLPRAFAIVIGTMTALGLLLAASHGIEAAIWAAAYLWLGALGAPEAAVLSSIDSMATRGASGITVQPHCQMMGALEAADGMRPTLSRSIWPTYSTWKRLIMSPSGLFLGCAAPGRSPRRCPAVCRFDAARVTPGWSMARQIALHIGRRPG